MQISGEVADIVNRVFSMAESAHFEYVTPELFLICDLSEQGFCQGI